MSLVEVNHIWQKKSLQILMQSEAAECGLACLGMIANYHGHDYSLLGLRSKYPTSIRGLSLGEILKIADDLQLEASPYKIDLEQLHQLETPCILHWDLNHFVVCKKVTKHTAIIYDPASGVSAMRFREVSKHFTGIALELKPNVNFHPEKMKPQLKIRNLVGKVGGIKKSFLTASILSFYLLLLTLIMPYFSMIIIDHVLVINDTNLLHTLGIAFCCAVIFNSVGRYLRNYYVLHIGAQLFQQLTRHIARHILSLPLAFFEKRHAGDILSRLDSLEYIKHLISEEVVATILDGVLAMITLFMMMILAPKLSFVVIFSGIFFAIFRFATYPAMYRASEERLIAKGKEESVILESLRSIQSIKLYSGEMQRLALWMRYCNQSMNAQNRYQIIGMTGQSIGHLIFGIEEVLILWIAAIFVMNGQMTIGVLVAFLSYKHQFVQVFHSLIDKCLELRLLDLHANRLGDLLLQEGEKKTHGHFSFHLEGPLVVKSLSFRYNPQEPYLFRNIDFMVMPGESVVIVGSSGSGKTTLVKVLLGLLPPSEGEIYVGKIKIENIMNDYRQQIATVMQDDCLISGSIADNIAFFVDKPDFDWIVACAKMAHIHDEIMEMPMGYQSLLSEFGTFVSGGQKQRILLARAFYRRPRILFLDEATSALDLELERKISLTIKQAAMTRVMIAHRPETIAQADRILLLKDYQLHPATLSQVAGF